MQKGTRAGPATNFREPSTKVLALRGKSGVTKGSRNATLASAVEQNVQATGLRSPSSSTNSMKRPIDQSLSGRTSLDTNMRIIALPTRRAPAVLTPLLSHEPPHQAQGLWTRQCRSELVLLQPTASSISAPSSHCIFLELMARHYHHHRL